MNPSDLPPGVHEFMLPGNTPEDKEWETLFDWLYDCGLTPQEIGYAVADYKSLTK